MAQRQRLTAVDWITAALDALASGGVAAVAVEPLATRLGTTKGSFYWHFSGRDALLEAALQHWEQVDTDGVIAQIEAEPDIPARLRNLLTIALAGHGAPRDGRVELALQATADHPLVAPVLARVTERRLAYVADLFAELGFTPAEARRRSLLAYTSYLGHIQLAHATPQVVPTADQLPDYVDGVIAALCGR